MPQPLQWLYNASTHTNQPPILWPLYRSTCIIRHLQLRTGGFCWCKGFLPARPCWRQPAQPIDTMKSLTPSPQLWKISLSKGHYPPPRCLYTSILMSVHYCITVSTCQSNIAEWWCIFHSSHTEQRKQISNKFYKANFEICSITDITIKMCIFKTSKKQLKL